MAVIVRRRLLITALVTLLSLLLAFRPIAVGPIEDYRVEITIRYSFPKPFSELNLKEPIELKVKELLEKDAKADLASVKVAGESLLIIEDESPDVAAAEQKITAIQKAMKKAYPGATVVEATYEEIGRKPVARFLGISLFAPQPRLHLGLDLRGGSRIVLLCHRAEFAFQLGRTAAKTEAERQALQEKIVRELERQGLLGASVRLDPSGTVVIVRTQSEGSAQVERDLRIIQKTLNALVGVANEIKDRRAYFTVDESTLETVRQIIDLRINRYGVAEPQIYAEGRDRVVVEMPGVRNPEAALRLIGEMGNLEFRDVPPRYQVSEGAEEGESRVLFRDQKGNEVPAFEVYRQSRLIVSGKELVPPATARLDPTALTPREAITVHLRFNREGARKFAEFTRRNIGKPLAIWYDKECISAPTVQDYIPHGEAYITGLSSMEEALLLKVILDAGALPVPVSVLWRQTVSPTLGADTVVHSLQAGLLGILGVCLFMVLYYRLPGLLACLALFIYASLVLAVMSLHIGQWRPVLTLPGIVGLIVSFGMAVDVNVITFERLKEELRTGKPLRMALEMAFDRSWTAILDSHVTIFLAALVLYWAGTGPVKGFATTLIIGTAANLFSALFSTRALLEAIVRTPLSTQLGLFQTFADTPFVRRLVAGS
ncbi:MAG: protein translocase subunit SecD [Armatimonadetes bacterium]|nr:protein translocase subunit SecD [Armatimonadota bacterium]MDW8120981.1 protein translocase subunit SecD [Armatimonadota bacterium]